MHKLDEKITKLLDNKPTHSSEIARNLGVLRTTVQYRLRRMEVSGIVKSSKLGRKTMWKLNFNKGHNKNFFRIYKEADIYKAYEQILDLPKNSIILAVQGSDGADKEFLSLPITFIKKAHRILKKRNIILKGISNEKALGVFNDIDSETSKSHIGRTLSTKFFSGDVFLGSGEIMSTKKILMLSNPKSKMAIVVKDRQIARIVYETLELLFDRLDECRVFDLNYFLRAKTQNNP